MTLDLRDLLDDADRELAPLEKAYFLAEWKVAQEATDDGEQALVDASLAYDTALADQERYGALLAAEKRNGTHDTSLRRRLTVLRNGAAARQRPRDLAEAILRREASLASLYSLHRGELGGAQVSDNEIEEVLRTSTDPAERRAAWEASKSIGPGASDQVRELAALRNEAARALGYRDHFAMSLQLDELDEDWLFALLDRLDTLLAPSSARVKEAIDEDQRRRLGLPGQHLLRPWDYGDPFFQDPPPAPDDAFEAAASRSRHDGRLPGVLRGARRAGRRDPGPQRPVPAPQQEPARVLHPDRADRRRPRPGQRRAGRALARDDAARAGPRGLRAGHRPGPAVDAADAGAHLHHRGDRDAARPAGPRPAVPAPLRGPRRGRRRPAPRRDGAPPAARLRALGPGDDALRAGPLRRSRGRPRPDLVGARRALPARRAARRARGRTTGPRSSTWRCHRSTTRTTCWAR